MSSSGFKSWQVRWIDRAAMDRFINLGVPLGHQVGKKLYRLQMVVMPGTWFLMAYDIRKGCRKLSNMPLVFAVPIASEYRPKDSWFGGWLFPSFGMANYDYQPPIRLCLGLSYNKGWPGRS